jgi:hypothetical protein
MGYETANIHLGCRDALRKKVLVDLHKKRARWLHESARNMTQAVIADKAEMFNLR